MYIPKSFNIENLSTLHAFIQRYSFATGLKAAGDPGSAALAAFAREYLELSGK